MGSLHRVYNARFEYVWFPSGKDVRYAFTRLWKEVEFLESPAEVGRAAAWLAAWKRRSAGQQ
ncbi:MAG: hypothetical protein H0T92_24555 [Pyrinomonadaceae bacterium]|nr:hypothetical protein [Pyrinomonadaceae bacterium]